MRFAARFLVDFGPKEWYWCVERYENGIGEETGVGFHGAVEEELQPARAARRILAHLKRN